MGENEAELMSVSMKKRRKSVVVVAWRWCGLNRSWVFFFGGCS